MFLPRLVRFYIKSLGINLGKKIDEKLTCTVGPFTPISSEIEKYYAYNSIQTFKKSLVYIQKKAPSSICSSVRNNSYNPFHVYDK